jgi:hypothetical protein
MADEPIPALQPRGPGHRFVVYGDSCSGVPGAPHEACFAAVNAVLRRIVPPPEFILFPGDEVIGLTPDPDALRAQWRHWLDVEMAWLDRRATPVWHTTGNHTAWDTMSEAVFRDVLRLPGNGPEGQEGLSYWVRRGDLLMVFVHTLWTGLGGEGHVETDWLRDVLRAQADARHRIALGHHPVFPVNGFSGSCQREIAHEDRDRFWDVLVEGGVAAYVCSHILAFDVQVHRGVLQLCTAGAGTAHRMPEGIEYLHCVQAALDAEGLRCQVLDTTGRVREEFAWPPPDRPGTAWTELPPGERAAAVTGRLARDAMLELRCRGRTPAAPHAREQTFLAAHGPGALAPVWLGLRGARQVLTLVLARAPGRSPAYWLGPALGAGRDFDIEVGIRPAMGPGGILWRAVGERRWTSFAAAAATGAEALDWPARWSVGHGQFGAADRPFAGAGLRLALRGP